MSSPSSFPPSFVGPWKQLLRTHGHEQRNDFPNNHVADPDSLITSSIPRTLYVGTGLSIFERAILPAILSAQREVHFVTCYWADSPTLDALRDTLLKLASSRRAASSPPLRITFGFSSRGLFQKLFHTASREGHVYPPTQWPGLGLPDEATLRAAGIEVTVKSLFFTPLSVMHPKYVIVDGCRAWVPSCNVSWERWLEGCVELEGDIVAQLRGFHERVWGYRVEETGLEGGGSLPVVQDATERLSASQSLVFPAAGAVPTIFLPSSHHRNPRFSFFPFLSQSSPPMTPLNAALLTLIDNAQRSITIITPNVTSQPVVDALLSAVQRGVDVQIRTSKGMMLIEQLVTAGTTTSRCLNGLIKKYSALAENAAEHGDVEAQTSPLGALEVLYYRPLEERRAEADEPVVSHFKMTLVDGEFLVLGSGNMDRASWWTSQEIGVLFYVPGFEGNKVWDQVWEKRTEVFFRSKSQRE
ncbi:hypothetical protein S7711_03904 [Stachybotrys chartarum IBT 7711]|uniref:PLD phosphodiesterase domain-containing protein n=1 Tax=Stachybotrys chartarum (strain CBS 109288 / IBT 7711) TaxID=1280523 RepID=A0A084AHY4_STACB|nr:hypothetical protein S7711_03904 [Stachybotrys chartarum IBT 7711]